MIIMTTERIPEQWQRVCLWMKTNVKLAVNESDNVAAVFNNGRM